MKVDTLIYVHHNGQFANPDMNDKTALKLGQRLYLQILYDVRRRVKLYENIILISEILFHL